MKNPADKAWRLWQEPEFKMYLVSKTKELLAGDLDLSNLMKETSDRLKESIGAKERVLIGESPKAQVFFFSDPVISPSAKDAKDYLDIFERLIEMTVKIGPIMEEISSMKTLELKEEDQKHRHETDKEKLEIERKRNNNPTGTDNVPQFVGEGALED